MGEHTLLRLSPCKIRGHVIIMSQCIGMSVQEACEGGISYFTMDKRGVLTCISVLKELCNGGSA
jgi:hypothetical protein